MSSTVESHRLRRVLGPLRAMALSLGVVIGAGIFVLPAYVAPLLPSGVWFGGIWLIAGALSLCTAVCYAELATVFPRTGGYVVYLQEVYGDRMAFLYGWAALLVLYPAGIATVGRAFAEAAQHLLGLQGTAAPLSMLLVAAAIAVNASGVELSSRSQVLLSGLKLLALLALALAGVLLLPGARLGTEAVLAAEPAPGLPGLSRWFLAFVIASWCFDGYLEIVVVAGEVQRPARTLWRVLVGTVILITAIYLLYAIALLRHLGIEGIGATSSPAADLAGSLFGAAGTVLMDLLVMLATASGVLAVLFSGPRLLVALADAGLFYSWAGRVSARGATPRHAVLVMGAAALLYAALGRLDELVKYFSVYTGLFSGLILVGGMMLRGRGKIDPSLQRIPLWPLAPVLAIAASVGGMIYVVQDQPRSSLAGLAILLVALPLSRRLLAVRRLRQRDGAEQD